MYMICLPNKQNMIQIKYLVDDSSVNILNLYIQSINSFYLINRPCIKTLRARGTTRLPLRVQLVSH